MFSFTEALTPMLLEHSVFIKGDLTLPHFSLDPDRHIACAKTRCFVDFCNLLNLTQFNGVVNRNNNILDLVLSNTKFETTVHHEQFPLVREDLHHPALSINTFIEFPDPIPFPSATNVRYNFRKADYIKLYSDLLNADWSFLDAHNDVNVALEKFNMQNSTACDD